MPPEKLEPSKTFSAKDICAIIKSGADFGVKNLILYGVGEITWGREAVPPVEPQNPHTSDSTFEEPPAAITSPEGEEFFTAESKQIQEDLRLVQLMTDDPVAYEQEMIDTTDGGGDFVGEEY